MFINYNLQNILGSFYRAGQLTLHPINNTLFSPVNNRIKLIDLQHNITSILNFQCQHNIAHVVVDPSGNILVAVDEQGQAILYNLKGNFIISHFNFKGKIKGIVYSPDGKLLAIGQQRGFRIYQAPKFWRSFQPLILLKKYNNRHVQKVSSINFSPDSKFLITSGTQNVIYLNNVLPIPDYVAINFDVHKYKIISTFFNEQMSYLYSIDKGGNIYVWKWTEDYKSEAYIKMQAVKKRKIEIQQNLQSKFKLIEIKKDQNQQQIQKKIFQNQEQYSDFQKRINNGRFILAKKLIISLPGCHPKKITFLKQINMLASCYNNGKFSIWKLQNQQLNQIHTFSIGTENKISSISLNFTGSWLAIAVKDLGQLIVWQWKSQTYVFNQSGLIFNTTCSTYSPDMNIIATGNSQGKVRLWDQKSGFCYSSFQQHQSNITDIRFSNQTTLFSSSLDGTVNAYDIIKYKKFRTLIPDKKCQLMCLALQSSGQIICAGSFDPYEVYCWNLQTGNLIQIISGHTAPISCIQFANDKLITGSWDRTIRITDFFSRKSASQALDHGAQITAIAISPNKLQMAIATLKGQVYIWKIQNSQVIGILDCRKDLKGGRKTSSKISADNDTSSKHLKTLKYSQNGQYLIGGGRSKYILLYDIKHRLLLRRFLVTNNKDIDGVVQKLNSKYIRQGININEIQIQSGQSSDENNNNYLPGARKFDVSKRSKKIQILVNNIMISNKQFAACTNFGLLIFQQSKKFQFSPVQLLPNLTPNLIPTLLNSNQITAAIIVCLSLNLPIQKLIKKISILHVPQIVNQLNPNQRQAFIQKLCTPGNSTQQLDQRRLIWIESLIKKVDKQKISKGLIKSFSRIQQINRLVKKNIAMIQTTKLFKKSILFNQKQQ